MKLYKKFQQHLDKVYHLESIQSLLGWDQEICMNSSALDFRAEQISHLDEIHHEIFLNKEFRKILKKLKTQSKNLSLKKRKNFEHIYKNYLESKNIPKKFIKKSSEVQTRAYDAWLVAKKESNFSVFKDHLSAIIEDTKEGLSYIGKKGYDAVLSQFEEGIDTKLLDNVFNKLKEKLVPFIAEQEEITKNYKVIKGRFEKNKQKQYCLNILSKIGYDLGKGRLDESEHPFSLLISPNDSRLTVNYQEENLVSIWSALHEGGHGIYEQGLNSKEYSLPSGQALNNSIHESQSRFYEILIGKNINFWKNEYPNLLKHFNVDLTLEDFVRSLGRVERNSVRLEADDLSYHLHIIIRYEVERMIFDENLSVDDLQEVWNDKYKNYLGVTPETDSRSVLQDCHWATASFGYFPTYSLGTFYAHQFYEQLYKEEPNLLFSIHGESLKEIKIWLNKKIHKLGSYLNSEEICKEVTGEGLNLNHFLNFYDI